MADRKTERILNLLIALMSTRIGRTRDYLLSTVYRYWQLEGTPAASIERMFERDKGELRDLGVPIETLGAEERGAEDTHIRYRVHAKDYLLSGLELSTRERVQLQLAAQLWEQSSLRNAGGAALRKLGGAAHDAGAVPASLLPSISVGGAALEVLHAALAARHEVSFDYRASGAQSSTQRRVQPYGLGNRDGSWYLVGFDVDRGAERTFLLSRIIAQVTAWPRKNFVRPQDFSIAAALDRMAAYPARQAQVLLPQGRSWAWRHQADRLEGDRAWISYKDEASFLAQAAAAAPEVKVVAPAALASATAQLLSAAVQGQQGELPEPVFGRKGGRGGPKSSSEDAVRRLLAMIPFLVRNNGITKDELAAEFKITPEQLDDDLQRIQFVGRPEGFHNDLMDIAEHSGRVWIQNALDLSRPVRFSPQEAWTLLVGLRALQDLVADADRESIARLSLRIAAACGDAAELARDIHVQVAPEAALATTVEDLSRAVQDQLQLRIHYIVPSRDEITDRTVDPHLVRLIDGHWYLDAWCHRAEAARKFRLDRIVHYEITDTPVTRHRPSQPPEALFSAEASQETAVVLADARHRWLMTRLAVQRSAEQPDGALLAELPWASIDWLAALVAQTGGGIRVIAPEAVRDAVQQRLDAALAVYAHVSPTSRGSLG